MKTLTVENKNNINLVYKDKPECKKDEVIVHVKHAGICGSDIHILHGNNPFVVYPRVTGHEFAGIINELGSNVDDLTVGDHVVIDPVISCGECRPCRNGRFNSCLNMQVFGVHRDGGFSEYQSVPAKNIYKISKDVPLKQAALVEPYTIAANVFDRLKPNGGDRVLIYGAGVIGLTLVQVAKILGIPSIVIDVVDAKLELAKEFGAEYIINSKRVDVEKKIMELTEGEGVPLIADAVCIPALLPQIIRLAAPAGSVCLLGFSAEPSALVQMEVIKKELTIVGSRLNNKMFPRVIKWMESGQLNAEAIVTHDFGIDEYLEAFDQIETNPENTRKVRITL